MHDAEIAALDLEHVEVVQEAPRRVQPPAGARRPARAGRRAAASRRPSPALEEAEHERVVLRAAPRRRRADAGLRGRDRVVQLVLAVDREQARVLVRDADDVAAVRRRDLVVRVRQPARERLDARRRAAPGTASRTSSSATARSYRTWILAAVMPERARAVVIGGGVIGCSSSTTSRSSAGRTRCSSSSTS